MEEAVSMLSGLKSDPSVISELNIPSTCDTRLANKEFIRVISEELAAMGQIVGGRRSRHVGGLRVIETVKALINGLCGFTGDIVSDTVN